MNAPYITFLTGNTIGDCRFVLWLYVAAVLHVRLPSACVAMLNCTSFDNTIDDLQPPLIAVGTLDYVAPCCHRPFVLFPLAGQGGVTLATTKNQ